MVWCLLAIISPRKRDYKYCARAATPWKPHICYGYGIKENIEWKKTLGDEWSQYEKTFPVLAKSRIDQASVECAGSRVPIPLLELLQGKDIMVSVIDVATNHIESPEEAATTIYDAMCYVLADHIIPCTNCGMVPL